MTLTAAVRVPFSRAIANLRQEWDLAGVDDAMVQLSQQTPDPGECLARMVAWARRADARTPAGVLHAAPSEPAPTRIVTETPASLTVWCPTHEAQTKPRPDGRLACCWADSAGIWVGYRRPGVTAPPADFRDRVAAARERSAGKATEEG